MRLLIDSLIAIMLAGILAGLVMNHRHESAQLEQVRRVHQSLARLQEQVIYHGALEQADADRSATGFPMQVSPMWFDNELPVNAMVPGRQPWMDLAPEGDMADHPPDPVVTGPTQASFWYNPNRGIVRARVQPRFSDHETLDLYNRLNGSSLPALPEHIGPGRTPLAMPLTLASESSRRDASAEPPAALIPAVAGSVRGEVSTPATAPPPPLPRLRPSLRDRKPASSPAVPQP